MTFDRRTVVLGVVAAAAVAAAAAVTVLGQSSGASPERRNTAAYIERVNAIQTAMRAPLARVMRAYRDFTGQGRADRDVAAELGGAATTLRRLDRKLAAEPAPAEARRLRARLLALVGGQAAVTREVERLSVFSPRYGAALASARAANARLTAALAAVAVPKAHALKGTKQQVLDAQRAFQREARAAAGQQADAIEAYESNVAAVIARLNRLVPPDVLRPSYTAQIEAFRRIQRSGAKLAAELRTPGRGNVAALAQRFALASRIAQSTAVQRAQIAAIERYNARARALSASAAAVRAELLRLQRSLP